MEIKVGASILAGDFGHIAKEVQKIEEAGADSIHIDIMDGHFVPNFTMGPDALAAIRRTTSLFLSVHLMIYNPFNYVEKFIEAGADLISFHFEATENVEEVLQYIRRCNCKAGLAFNPETSFSMIPKYLDQCDQILLMTVDPGFAGQKFLPKVIEKIRLTRETCNKSNIRQAGVVAKGLVANSGEQFPPFDIVIDGGINLKTGRECVKAGANYLVSGSYLFKQKDMKIAINNLRGCGEKK